MSQRHLFPTLLHQARLPGTSLLDELEEACWMIEDGDQAGHDWCEREGYPGYTSYASLDDLPDRHPAFSELRDVLESEARAFSKALHWDLGEGKLVLDSLWVNILGEGGSHSTHIHPNSVISGTVYVAMPDGAGALMLEDPRLAAFMAAPPLKEDAPEDQRRFVYLKPAPGQVLMWESWLRHQVGAGTTEEARISVSFNLSWR